VLSNLVLNAMMHGFADRKQGTITVRASAVGADEIEVAVSDDGCGMSPQIRHHAFEPFFSTRRHEGATGLGLHIVHSMVVDRLEGRLLLVSEPGVGTTIRVILPRSIRFVPDATNSNA
jgi:signal transduction histidine kinase